MTTTKHQDIRLTVFELKKLEYWQDRLTDAVRRLGGSASRKGMSVALWRANNLVPIRGTSLSMVEGVKVVREMIGQGKGALVIIPRRMYFLEGSDQPCHEPEWKLLGNRRIALPSPSTRIQHCLDWAKILGECVDGFNPEPMKVAQVREALHVGTKMVFGKGAMGVAGSKVSSLLMKNGFYKDLGQLHIEMVVPGHADVKARFYQQQIANALGRCKSHGVVSLNTYEKFSGRMDGSRDVMPENSVVLLAVTGKKGLPLAADARKLIELMTIAKIPFRMFSLDNPALNWSALDQVGTLVSGAGGIPFKVDLPWLDSNQKPFLVGVDLGHPMSQRVSRVVISLMDHQGILLGAWRCVQERNETIGENVLRQGLKWVLNTAKGHGNGRDAPSFLVLRDGRLHKGEKVAFYRQELGTNMTLVEFSKYDNPEMYVADSIPASVEAGTECLLEGSATPFIAPISPRLANDLAKTFKIKMDAAWDGLVLGMARVCEIIIGLSYTPGLGLAQHALPGPVYWADGIAAIGGMNNQFAGQRIHGERG